MIFIRHRSAEGEVELKMSKRYVIGALSALTVQRSTVELHKAQHGIRKEEEDEQILYTHIVAVKMSDFRNNNNT